MSALSSNQRMEIQMQPEIYGRWVESALGAHLLNQSITQQIDLYYWREGNYEVDFVLQKGNKTIGIEVKSGRIGEPSLPCQARDIYSARAKRREGHAPA
jgi:predicted AAA+ superfamily ATPase